MRKKSHIRTTRLTVQTTVLLLVMASLVMASLVMASLVFASLALAQSSDYLPTVRVGGVNIDPQVATLVAPTFTFSYIGTDPDAAGGLPSKVRFLLVSADLDGFIINTRYRYETHMDELFDFSHDYWSEWMPYPSAPENARITFPDMPDGEHFVFAVQVMDADGAVSMGRGYAREVVNFQVRSEMFRPSVVLNEYYLGTTTNNRESEIASGQPLNFSWTASADAYGGQIVSYRYGWDLVDPDDQNDPGWALPPGTSPLHMYAQELSFNSGYHTFFLRVEDDSGQVSLLRWNLLVVPFVPLNMQLPLLLIDQTVDANSNAWPSPEGVPLDNESYRNAYWQFLEGAGGVSGFNWSQDRLDHTNQVRYSDLVAYQTVLVYARNHSSQLMFNEFRPENDQDKYVWLTPYQQRGGHLFLVGAQSMESFLEQKPNYMVPFVFDTEEEYYVLNGETYVVGFGQAEMPDGSMVPRGPRQYPYDAAGIAALDWSVPLNKHIYGRAQLANHDRQSECAGIKGLVLTDDFRTQHQVSSGAIADTILTEANIDWRDSGLAAIDSLDTAFPFTGDEFVNANISARTTPIIPQECDDSPSGYCVEPMFTGHARFDWLRHKKWIDGQVDWPHDTYTAYELENICGELALTTYEGEVPLGSARSNGLTYGYLSYKNIEDKPNPKANVYWGFDPYRFNHDESKDAIRWVLDYFGLNLNQ